MAYAVPVLIRREWPFQADIRQGRVCNILDESVPISWHLLCHLWSSNSESRCTRNNIANRLCQSFPSLAEQSTIAGLKRTVNPSDCRKVRTRDAGCRCLDAHPNCN